MVNSDYRKFIQTLNSIRLPKCMSRLDLLHAAIARLLDQKIPVTTEHIVNTARRISNTTLGKEYRERSWLAKERRLEQREIMEELGMTAMKNISQNNK